MTRAQYPWPGLGTANTVVGALANRVTPFYRRFPYRGRLWWTEVDMRAAVCPEARFFYNRLPKNANTTVTALLAERVFGEAGAARPKHSFTRPSRLSSAQVASLDTDYLKFVILRDPYTRTLSAFLDKVLRPRTQRRGPGLWFARHGIDTPRFEDFCRYLDDGGLFDDNHWAPQTHGLLLPLDRFDMVARFETLETDLDAIHRRIFGDALGTLGRRGSRRDGDAKLAAHYTPRAAETVTRLYAEDFETLGYPRRDVTG